MSGTKRNTSQSNIPEYFNLKFKYDGPPTVKKKKTHTFTIKIIKMMGFDAQHIKDQLAPKKAQKIKKIG